MFNELGKQDQDGSNRTGTTRPNQGTSTATSQSNPYKSPIKIPSDSVNPGVRTRSSLAVQCPPEAPSSSTISGLQDRDSDENVDREEENNRVEVRDDSVQTENTGIVRREEIVEKRSTSSFEDENEEKNQKQKETADASVSASTRGASTSFHGFARLDRKWFDESGYNGCLDRLEELERIVESQFEDLSSKGYDVASAFSHGMTDADSIIIDNDSPLSMKKLQSLEKVVEKQHQELIENGVLPQDSVKIFTA